MAGSGARVVSGQLLATIAVGVGLALMVAAALTYRQVSKLLLAQQAPAAVVATWPDGARQPAAVTLTGLDGRPFALRGQQGQVVVLALAGPGATAAFLGPARDLATARSGLPAGAPAELVVVSDAGTVTSASTSSLAARAAWTRSGWQWHWLTASPAQLASIRRACGLTSVATAAGQLCLIGSDGYQRASFGGQVPPGRLSAELKKLA